MSYGEEVKARRAMLPYVSSLAPGRDSDVSPITAAVVKRRATASIGSTLSGHLLQQARAAQATVVPDGKATKKRQRGLPRRVGGFDRVETR